MTVAIHEVWKWTLAAFVFVVAVLLFFALSRTGHRKPPWPDGAVLRVDARESSGIFDEIRVVRCGVDPTAIEVHSPGRLENTVVVQRFRCPSGEELPAVEPGAEEPVLGFEFDGDGAFDRIEEPTGASVGLVRVVSGRDGSILFEDADAIEYETQRRAFPLGDMDGDGCAELALVHPRQDRSRYDLELWDRFLGAKSWITIVSGREATR